MIMELEVDEQKVSCSVLGGMHMVGPGGQSGAQMRMASILPEKNLRITAQIKLEVALWAHRKTSISSAHRSVQTLHKSNLECHVHFRLYSRQCLACFGAPF
jgi:hypothetical protein